MEREIAAPWPVRCRVAAIVLSSALTACSVGDAPPGSYERLKAQPALQYMWWRPVTAIRLGDNDTNDDTVGDTEWTPLITTPPYPDWPSGLCSVVGATSTALTRLNGNGMLNLTIFSPTAAETRTYAASAEIQSSAVDARVWSGIHFRHADEVSIVIGTQVANYVLDHYFAPTD